MGEFIRKKCPVLHLNNTEGGEESSINKMLISTDKNNKLYSFQEINECQMVPHVMKNKTKQSKKYATLRHKEPLLQLYFAFIRPSPNYDFSSKQEATNLKPKPKIR